MSEGKEIISTGLPGLDRVLQGLRAGDNVVWEVDGMEDYKPVLGPICREALRLRRKLVYFRFANHPPLLSADSGAEIHELDPQEGFERFLTNILDVIERSGRGAFYVFDCLSDLAADWFSDRMLGNFFMITCPYLYELDTIAYFALIKHQHSLPATDAIFRTAQVIIGVYRKSGRIYIHPMKVWQRYSRTMYALHSWEGDEFKPVTSSATVTDILAGVPKPWLEFTVLRTGVWDRAFHQAQQMVQALQQGQPPPQDPQAFFKRLVKMVATRDPRFQELAAQYFDLSDLVGILQRMVGTGLIGGKSLGMLLARAILRKADAKWSELLEEHDSFYVGSDVFYTYLVQNGCWWLRRRHRDLDRYLQQAEEARRKIIVGTFPEHIQHQFMEMLEYFGQSPLIVRSSSLLEDNYGNAFSGKYESVFLTNQGTPQERLDAFMNAVRTVYASAISEEGLRYRLHHGLLDRDEQMALLVQRVSGELHGGLFFPQLAGVGFSFNPFVWHEDIDPNAGVLRLVFGLGTRAVDRTDDDYTRLVALNAPLKRRQATSQEARQFAQRRVDVVDLDGKGVTSRDFESVARAFPGDLLDLFVTRDEVQSSCNGAAGAEQVSGALLFERLLSDTAFASAMRELSQTLQEAYRYPVDIEFAANFTRDGQFRIHLLQCRPFQVKIGSGVSRVEMPEVIEPRNLFLQSRGPIIGHSVATAIDRVLYVVPSVYGHMRESQRYSVARTIGRLMHLDAAGARSTVMLVGPGRWGTSMPSLGVPVSFAEINTASVICELALMHEGLVPDVSLGTHFFNDLVEMDMLYLAVSPGLEGHVFNEDFIRQRPNLLARLLPSAEAMAQVLWVVDSGSSGNGGQIFLNVDSMKQCGVCYQVGSPPGELDQEGTLPSRAKVPRNPISD